MNREIHVVILLWVLFVPLCSAQDPESQPEARPVRRNTNTSTLGYGLGNDPVADRYLTSLEYQDLRLRTGKKKEPTAADKSGRTLVDVGELSVPAKALDEARKGRELRRKGKAEDALKHLRRAVEIHPAFGAAWVEIATIYRAAGRMAEAEEALLKAVEVSPQSLAARKHLGYLYLVSNRPALAVVQLAEAVRLEPADVGAKAFLGEALFKVGKLEDAEGALRAALALDPTCYPAAYRLSALYAGQKKFQEAIALLERILKQEHPGLATSNLQALVTRLRELDR